MEATAKTVMKPPGSYFKPLYYSMAGVASTTLLLLAYHLLLVKYCCRRRHNNNRGDGGSRRGTTTVTLHGQMGGRNYGVEKKVLETIPIMSYSSKNDDLMFRVDHQCECVVCLGELEDGDVVRLLPNCRHVFHVSCIDEWFVSHSSCPTCRSPIIAPIVSTNTNTNTSTDTGGDDLNVHLEDESRETDHTVIDILTRQQEIDGGSNGSNRLNGGLRHCVSFVFPIEEKPRRMMTELKRSLSLDQSYIIVEIQKEREQNILVSSSSSSSSSSIKTLRSIRQLDRVSSMLARSFSLIRLGKNSPNNAPIIPL